MHSFVVQLRDIFANNVTTPQPNTTEIIARFTNSIGGTLDADISFPVNATYYLATYNITVAAAYTLNIAVDGSLINNITYGVSMRAGNLSVGSALAYGSLNSMSGWSLRLEKLNPFFFTVTGIAGGIQTFYVQIRDRYGNNVTTPDFIPTANAVLSSYTQQFNATIQYQGEGVS
jgi:hypothetical protein